MDRGDRVPKEVRLKLEFLWRSANDAMAETPPRPRLAQSLCASLLRAAAAHRVDVPADVAAALCPKCAAIRAPGVTSRARTKTRTRRSPASRRWASERRGVGHAVRCQVATTCLLCADVERSPGAPRPPARAQKRVAGDFVSLAPAPPPQPRPKTPEPRLLLDAKPRKRRKPN